MSHRSDDPKFATIMSLGTPTQAESGRPTEGSILFATRLRPGVALEFLALDQEEDEEEAIGVFVGVRLVGSSAPEPARHLLLRGPLTSRQQRFILHLAHHGGPPVRTVHLLARTWVERDGEYVVADEQVSRAIRLTGTRI